MPKDEMYFYIGKSDKNTNLTIGLNLFEFSMKYFNKLSDIEEEPSEYKKKPTKKVLYKRNYNK